MPVLHSPLAAIAGAAGAGDDSLAAAEVAFGAPGAAARAWCPRLSVAAVAASAGGVWAGPRPFTPPPPQLHSVLVHKTHRAHSLFKVSKSIPLIDIIGGA